MLGRIGAIALNTFREAVRARVLFGLFAAALAVTAYSLVVAAMSVRGEMRVVADLGAASTSLFAVVVAIVLGATTLHRELELKTVYPILTRRLVRHEYLVGKYLGILATVGVFVALDSAAVLGILASQSHASAARAYGLPAALAAGLVVALVAAKRRRAFVLLPFAPVALVVMAFAAADAGPEARLVVASAALTVAEVAIVAAVATLFSSFSSPFLTSVFTLGVFFVGRSADTLAHLPPKAFGETMRGVGAALARVFPNLQAYVPARPILLGEVEGVPLAPYVAHAWLVAAGYAIVLLAVGALVFRRRDFA